MLHEAVRLGDVSIVKLLLDTGQIDIEQKNSQGCTALEVAGGHEDEREAIVELLERHRKVEFESSGWVPLPNAKARARLCSSQNP